jgi:hypothetical protein
VSAQTATKIAQAATQLATAGSLLDITLAQSTALDTTPPAAPTIEAATANCPRPSGPSHRARIMLDATERKTLKPRPADAEIETR